MDLKLANDVVYAILGAIVVVFLIVYTARIVKLRAKQPKPLVIESAGFNAQGTAPWPAVSKESETRPIGK